MKVSQADISNEAVVKHIIVTGEGREQPELIVMQGQRQGKFTCLALFNSKEIQSASHKTRNKRNHKAIQKHTY